MGSGEHSSSSVGVSARPALKAAIRTPRSEFRAGVPIQNRKSKLEDRAPMFASPTPKGMGHPGMSGRPAQGSSGPLVWPWGAPIGRLFVLITSSREFPDGLIDMA